MSRDRQVDKFRAVELDKRDSADSNQRVVQMTESAAGAMEGLGDWETAPVVERETVRDTIRELLFKFQ